MCKIHERKKDLFGAHTFVVGGVIGMILLGGVAFGATDPVIYFSTEESFTATAGPHAGQVISHGDLLSTSGDVIARNSHLIRNFNPMPVPPDYGLDGVYLRPSGEVLFSIEDRFWDESLSTWVGHGDLLSDSGVILQTNGQLLSNFGPMPSVPPYDWGLDAIHEPPPRDEVLFSIEETFWDEVLGVWVQHGDLLSDTGTIVKSNLELMTNFGPMPSVPPADYGLDGVHVFSASEIWFSIENGFWDEVLGVQVSDGDLLSIDGSVEMTNAELLAAFFGGAGSVPADYGLDAVWVVPEPTTLCLLALGGMVLRRKRRG